MLGMSLLPASFAARVTGCRHSVHGRVRISLAARQSTTVSFFCEIIIIIESLCLETSASRHQNKCRGQQPLQLYSSARYFF